MMKIHTTQNLSSLTQLQPTNYVSQSKEVRLKNAPTQEDTLEKQLSFKGKPDIIDKVAKSKGTKKWFEKMIQSEGFRKVLDAMDHEVVVQAAISAVVCVLLRPATIMGMSLFNEKSKEDNAYAATHSISSGIVGIIASILIAYPFSQGLRNVSFERYLKKVIDKGGDVEKALDMFKRMYPHTDMNTVARKVEGKWEIFPESAWRTFDGKKWLKSAKDAMTVARPTHVSDCAPETFKDMGVDLDKLLAEKGVSLEELIKNNDRDLLKYIKDKFLFIAVKEEGMGGSLGKDYKDVNFFQLKNIDKEFLKKIVPDIDMSTVKGHPAEWKRTNGEYAFKLGQIHLPSYRETFESTPLFTGPYREGNNKKYASYFNNAEGDFKLGDVPDLPGTPIRQVDVDADKVLDYKNKNITWLPDIATRVPVAMGTIAFIPWVLKHVFHMEKGKKPEKDSKQVAESKNDVKSNSTNPSFKAKGGGVGDKIGELYAKHYADRAFFGREWIQKFSEWASKVKGQMTEHYAALGAFITSSVYVTRTLKNDKLDGEKRKTLALNQALCFVIPTALSYYVNSKLGGFNKKLEHSFSGAMKGLVQTGKITDAEYKEFVKKLPQRLKSVKTLGTLVTFTLVYRYFSPVVITPIANWVSAKIRENKEKDAELAK